MVVVDNKILVMKRVKVSRFDNLMPFSWKYLAIMPHESLDLGVFPLVIVQRLPSSDYLSS